MTTKAAVKEPLTSSLIKKARLLNLAGDPTRVRILRFMYKNDNACVSEITKALGTSIACVSHHLQLMRDNGLLTNQRSGNNICYSLVQNDFTNKLKNIVCN